MFDSVGPPVCVSVVCEQKPKQAEQAPMTYTHICAWSRSDGGSQQTHNLTLNPLAGPRFLERGRTSGAMGSLIKGNARLPDWSGRDDDGDGGRGDGDDTERAPVTTVRYTRTHGGGDEQRSDGATELQAVIHGA